MPSPLVPGDPEALRSFVADLTAYGDGLVAAGDELKRVDSGESWSGDAAEAFRARYGAFTPLWFTAGDAFHDAAGAVGRYAEVLAWAQGRAADAERLQAQAHAMSQAATADYNANAARGVAQPPFVDPGTAIQGQARAVLDDATGQLDRAGNDAARAVQAATATVPPEPFWTRVGEGIAQVGQEIGAVASALGRAALDNPEAVVAAGIGVGAILLGATGDVGGGAISATGVGALVGVPTIVASTGLVVTGAAAVGAATMEMARDAKDNYKRPSGYRKGVRDAVFDKNKGTDGKVRDPKTKEEIKKEDKWDMGHKPGREFRKHQQDARDKGTPRKNFLDQHNDPDNYRPETPNTNRSGKLEDKTDKYGD